MTSGRKRAPIGEAKVHLLHISDPELSARHSTGARKRATLLLGFLLPLQRAAAEVLGPQGDVSLLVANSHDWRLICNYPYGLPFTRNLPNAAVIVAAADYSERLTRRFDDLLLEAGHAGVRAPGQMGEFLDLLIGHEWGHAMANRSGLRTGVKWLDEFMATYLFVQALAATGVIESRELLRRWTALQVAATRHVKGALDDFEYPRGRMSLSKLLWFQGVFTQRALELAPDLGWSLALDLRAALPAAEGGRFRRHKGDVARALIDAEPSFRNWFAIFGDTPVVDEQEEPVVVLGSGELGGSGEA